VLFDSINAPDNGAFSLILKILDGQQASIEQKIPFLPSQK
jgi:hypothetical protein